MSSVPLGPGSGAVTVELPPGTTVDIGSEVEVKNDTGNPVPTAALAADAGLVALATTLKGAGDKTLSDLATALATIAAGIPIVGNVEVTNDVGNAMPVSAAALPLPTGAATSANQTGGGQKTQVVNGANTLGIDSTGAIPLQSGGTTGSAVPARATQVGGSDGTNLRAIKVGTDGTVSVDSELPAPVTLADNLGNPTTSLIGACLMGWDTASMRRVISLVGSDGVSTGLSTLLTTAIGYRYNGSSSDKARSAVIFKSVTATASGDTVVWTPAAGKKFRLLGYLIEVPADASQSAAGDLDIVLKDASTALGLGHTVFVPSAAGTTFGTGYRSGQVQLGDIGKISAAANNVLNVNLSAALATGKVRVTAWGTEE